MSRIVPEERLPIELSPFEAVEAAYPDELAQATDALARGLPVLVECDKGLTPFFYKCLRDRLKREGLACAYLDGRAPDPGPGAVGPPPSIVATMIGQLRGAVRGAVERKIAVLPHLDLLTSSSGDLTSEAREVIPLLYENPNLLWLGFRDPSFALPRVIRDLFPQRIAILGVSRERLPYLVTQREARKLGRGGLDVYRLYKYVSGVHAAKLRRLLSALRGEDYPADPSPAWEQLRRATLEAGLSIPDLDLDRDIGGYAALKRRIREEILDVIAHKEALDDPERIARIERLVPRGIIFWGPPGTGKTLFAKAIASALGAAVQVVAGPELKSKWVGESEENLRRLFVQARQSAPALIVFDEIDSFASARGTYTGSGVEHSMVNQLLTEMDGFRPNEMVFVVGTTNFLEALDPALLRPGRFELALHVPYPDADDRRAILRVHDRRLGLSFTDEALEHAVRQSAYPLEGGSRWSGDHLQALCRTLARRRVRSGATGPTEVRDVDEALAASSDRPALTPAEERVVATHEAGHAVVALFCPHVPAIERISIRGDLAGALGFVSYADPAHRYVVTRGQLLDAICVLYGGREAELLLCDDLSIGSSHDLARATELARAVVERYGMGPDGVGVRDFAGEGASSPLSERTRAALDAAVHEVLEAQRERARAILEEQRSHVIALRDLLVERKVLDARALASIVGGARGGDDG